MHNELCNSYETKFLGLIIDDTLSWNQHIDKTATKLCSACYVLRSLKYIIPQSTLKTVYYACIHSILSCGIVFWGNSTSINKLFILWKRTVRILSNLGPKEPRREAFKNMEIMMLYSQYIYSLIIFTIENKYVFTPNNEIYKYSTRNNLNLHLPTINLSKFYKGPYILGTRAFN